MALRLAKTSIRLVRSAGYVRSSMTVLQKLPLNSASICQTFPMAHSFSTKHLVTYDEIKNLPKRPEALLIDVREPNELAETGVVPTSINIPLGQIAEKLSKEFPEKDFLKLFDREKPTHDTELIFMCKIGRRSHNAMDISRQLGYKNSRNYLGSWTEWAEKEGLPK